MKVVVITLPDDTPNPQQVIGAALQAAGIAGHAAEAPPNGVANGPLNGDQAPNEARRRRVPVGLRTPPRHQGGLVVQDAPRTPTRDRVAPTGRNEEAAGEHGSPNHPIVISPSGTADDPISVPSTPSRVNGQAVLLTMRMAASTRPLAHRDPPPPYAAVASTSGSSRLPAGQIDPRRHLQKARRIGPPPSTQPAASTSVSSRTAKKTSTRAATRQHGTR